MLIPYTLFFILLRRDWLRNMLLYVIWDITVTLFLLLSVMLIRIFLPQTYMQKTGSLLCIFVCSVLSAFILHLPRFQNLRLPGKFCAVIMVIYSVGRLVNTLFLLRFEEKAMQKMAVCSVIFLIIFLSLAIIAAYSFMNIYIEKKCRAMESTYNTGSQKNFGELNLMMQRIYTSCRKQNIQFDFRSTTALTLSGSNGRILYIIQLLFVLSRTLDGRTSGKILFTIQEHKGFLLLSACSTCPLGCRNRIIIIFALLHNSVLEILFNRMVQICHGYIQYLDSNPSGKHIRVAIPLSGQ